MIEWVPQISLATARTMAAAAAGKAEELGCAVVIAIVDAGGNLLLLEREAGAPVASVDIAQQKARCAVFFGFPTAHMEDAAKTSAGLASLPHMLPFGGGVPLRVDGRIAGAIGVSGAQAVEDAACAEAGIAAFAQAG